MYFKIEKISVLLINLHCFIRTITILKMATAIKSVSTKAICVGCSKEFTKDTLDKHSGVCGRCHNKKSETVSNPVLSLPSLATSTIPMLMPAVPSLTTSNLTVSNLITPNSQKTTLTVSPMTVSPMTTNATQYALPGELLKISNMSIEESKLNQAFTLNVRLDNWYKSARNNIPKNNAAVDVVYTLVKPHISNIDKIQNHNVLNFEKMFSTIHRSLLD